MASKLNVTIVGSGGREHAFGWKVKQSQRCGEIHFFPGNAGTLELGINVLSIRPTDPEFLKYIQASQITLVIIGPEGPLAEGVADTLRKAGILVVGPGEEDARLESSKASAKQLMRRLGVPTAPFKVFNDLGHALDYVEAQNRPLYIKASGLCAGKGAVACYRAADARQVVCDMMEHGKYGDAGKEIVIEEFLEGEEISIHVFVGGKRLELAPVVRDHKKLLEGDLGPNTGGMGAFGPVPISPHLLQDITEEILWPIIDATPNYRGILYPGLMLTATGSQVLEFNVRGGDPETQVLMRLMKSDPIDLFEMVAAGRLGEKPVLWHPGHAVAITIASRGYPDNPEKGKLIEGLDDVSAMPWVTVFHAGTVRRGDDLYTAGGRVLSVTAYSDNSLAEALERAYGAVELIHFDGMQYRKDIGAKHLATQPA